MDERSPPPAISWQARPRKHYFRPIVAIIYRHSFIVHHRPQSHPSTHLVHLPPEYHEVRIQELEVLVAIMDPDRVTRSAVDRDADQSPTADEGMSPPRHGIYHRVYHPPIQQYLDDVVQYHRFGEEGFHVVPRREVPLGDVLERREADEVEYREGQRHRRAVHVGRQARRVIPRGEGMVRPIREYADEDRRGGIPREIRWGIIFLRRGHDVYYCRSLAAYFAMLRLIQSHSSTVLFARSCGHWAERRQVKSEEREVVRPTTAKMCVVCGVVGWYVSVFVTE
jgi:hypothetical protein